MMVYNTADILIGQWLKNGDILQSEGEVVRHYRDPINGRHTCNYCGMVMDEHGRLDTADGGHVVCPCDWIYRKSNGEYYIIPDYINSESGSDELRLYMRFRS